MILLKLQALFGSVSFEHHLYIYLRCQMSPLRRFLCVLLEIDFAVFFVVFLPWLKTINCYSSSNLKLPQVGVGYCLLTLTIAPHETLTETDKSISHPLIALLVALLGLTAEVPGFSQRPNNTSMLQHLHFIQSSFIFHRWCCERLVEKNSTESMRVCYTYA